MKTKALLLTSFVAFTSPLAAMVEAPHDLPSSPNTVRLLARDPVALEGVASPRSRKARGYQTLQEGLLFVGSGLLTVTSVSCYTPEAPGMSLMMISGWSCLTMGFGLKFFQTLREHR